MTASVWQLHTCSEGQKEDSLLAELCREDPVWGFFMFLEKLLEDLGEVRVSANTKLTLDRRWGLTRAVRSVMVTEPLPNEGTTSHSAHRTPAFEIGALRDRLP